MILEATVGSSDDSSSSVNENEDEQPSSPTSVNNLNDQGPSDLPSTTDEPIGGTSDVPTTSQGPEQVSSATHGESQGPEVASSESEKAVENIRDANSLPTVTTNIDDQQHNRFLLSKEAHSLAREKSVSESQQLFPFPFIPGLTETSGLNDQSILRGVWLFPLSRWKSTSRRTVFSSYW